MRERLNANEVAAYLGLSYQTVTKYAKSGRIPSVALGPKLRKFSLPDVCRALGLPEPAGAETAEAR